MEIAKKIELQIKFLRLNQNHQLQLHILKEKELHLELPQQKIETVETLFKGVYENTYKKIEINPKKDDFESKP